MEHPRSPSHAPPGAEAVARLSAISGDGLAVLDADRRFAYLNPAGARILQVDPDRILGQPALVFAPPAVDGPAREGTGAVHRLPSADGARVVEHTEERHGDTTLVVFRDVTDAQRRERQLSAFAQTATALAGVDRLDVVLDDVAAALLEATGTAACTIVLYDDETHLVEQIGTAGGYPDDYFERLEGCRRRGAPLASLTAFQTGKPLVAPDWARRVLADPRWAPMHPVIRGRDWGALSAVPLSSQDGVIGALTTFYRAGTLPDAAEVAFLSSIAALVAVAVRNHRLLAALESKAALEERNRIARELHDSVSQSLFSLNLRSRALRLANENAAPGRRDRVRAGLDDLQELTSHVLGEMRALIIQLRPTELGDDGIAGAIRRHAAAICARDDIEITVEEAPDLPALSPETEVQVFRIVQEALNNVVRHARARQARVILRAGEALEVLVEDDGDGFDPLVPRPGHIGLRSMQERCEQLGGRLSVDSAPGFTQIRATIALDHDRVRPRLPTGGSA